MLVAALALWGSSRLAWLTVPQAHGSLDLAGGKFASWLVPLAIMTVAAIAAVLASNGVARRALGALFVVLGAGVVVLTVTTVAGDMASMAIMPTAAGDPVRAWTGPVVAIAGGVVLAAVGVVVAVWEKRLARWGASASGKRSSNVTSNDDADLWKALDEGRDPTDPGAAG